jgi:hypothetical protein
LGISGLVAASAHFVITQFDPTVLEECEFFSLVGAGRIVLVYHFVLLQNDFIFLVLVVVGICLSVVILLQLVWW